MVLLRELLGEALRGCRRAQKRTLRDVSKEANVSLGYLSEIERGHKEPSSELLASVCGALQVRLSEVLAEVAREVAANERRDEPAAAQGHSVPVLPLPVELESAEEPPRRRRHSAPSSPASIAQVRSRHRRGEVPDSVVRAAA